MDSLGITATAVCRLGLGLGHSLGNSTLEEKAVTAFRVVEITPTDEEAQMPCVLGTTEALPPICPSLRFHSA